MVVIGSVAQRINQNTNGIHRHHDNAYNTPYIFVTLVSLYTLLWQALIIVGNTVSGSQLIVNGTSIVMLVILLHSGIHSRE
jgi:hypothetical protein